MCTVHEFGVQSKKLVMLPTAPSGSRAWRGATSGLTELPCHLIDLINVLPYIIEYLVNVFEAVFFRRM